jgi:hypothetical protein
MSISLMTAAFKETLTLAQKMVLLALCDNANDQGECYPSVSMLTGKCSMSERGIQTALSQLVADGYVKRDFRKGRSTLYLITDPRHWPILTPAPHAPLPRTKCTPALDAPPQEVHPTPAPDAPPPPQGMHPTPAPGAPITINEPSVKPSGNHHKAAAKFSPLDELLSYGVAQQIAEDWLVIRKSKKQPLTKTALDGSIREAAKANMSLSDAVKEACERGWAGIKADWLKPVIGKPAGMPSQSQREAENREAFHLAFSGKRESEVIDG